MFEDIMQVLDGFKLIFCGKFMVKLHSNFMEN